MLYVSKVCVKEKAMIGLSLKKKKCSLKIKANSQFSEKSNWIKEDSIKKPIRSNKLWIKFSSYCFPCGIIWINLHLQLLEVHLFWCWKIEFNNITVEESFSLFFIFFNISIIYQKVSYTLFLVNSLFILNNSFTADLNKRLFPIKIIK